MAAAPVPSPETSPPAEPRFVPRLPRRGRRWPWVASLLVGFLAASLVVAWFAIGALTAPGPLDRDLVVVVPRGASVRDVARQLAEAQAVGDARLFELVARATARAGALQAGEYRIEAGLDLLSVLRLLRSGATLVRALTVPEGLTAAQVVALIAGAEALDGAPTQAVGEGALLPETYNYRRGDTGDELIARMRLAMDATLRELWEARGPDLPFNAPRDALILASIVEKETGRDDERRRVAAVFVNRLRRGMRLQSDPTVAYALTGGAKPLGRALTRDDLAFPNPYNTYQVDGLPPGPIANPGRKSLAAVLDPLDTKELYFVADGNGGHAFAETLDQHQRNVARWREQQRR